MDLHLDLLPGGDKSLDEGAKVDDVIVGGEKKGEESDEKEEGEKSDEKSNEN